MASYEQSKSSKLWSVRFRISVNGKNVNKRISGFKTKKEAQKSYIEFIQNHKPTEISADEIITFNDLFDRYLLYKKPRVKESSYLSIINKLEKNVLPYFKDKKISEITPVTILNWQNSLTDKGLSYKYKSGIRNALSSIYHYGERYHNLSNVISKVEPFRNLEPKKEMRFWSVEEFQKFHSAVDDKTYSLFFLLLYITGCRLGEAMALQWQDFDYQKSTLKINKNITRKTESGAWKITTPKNVSSNRIIDLPKKLCKQLETYKKENAVEPFIFGGVRPLVEVSLRRAFNRYIELSGVPQIRIHDLRHSCASYLISKGISIVAVSKRLGHKNIEQTLNTYSHMMPSDATKILSVLNEI